MPLWSSSSKPFVVYPDRVKRRPSTIRRAATPQRPPAVSMIATPMPGDASVYSAADASTMDPARILSAQFFAGGPSVVSAALRADTSMPVAHSADPIACLPPHVRAAYDAACHPLLQLSAVEMRLLLDQLLWNIARRQHAANAALIDQIWQLSAASEETTALARRRCDLVAAAVEAARGANREATTTGGSSDTMGDTSALHHRGNHIAHVRSAEAAAYALDRPLLALVLRWQDARAAVHNMVRTATAPECSPDAFAFMFDGRDFLRDRIPSDDRVLRGETHGVAFSSTTTTPRGPLDLSSTATGLQLHGPARASPPAASSSRAAGTHGGAAPRPWPSADTVEHRALRAAYAQRRVTAATAIQAWWRLLRVPRGSSTGDAARTTTRLSRHAELRLMALRRNLQHRLASRRVGRFMVRSCRPRVLGRRDESDEPNEAKAGCAADAVTPPPASRAQPYVPALSLMASTPEGPSPSRVVVSPMTTSEAAHSPAQPAERLAVPPPALLSAFALRVARHAMRAEVALARR